MASKFDLLKVNPQAYINRDDLDFGMVESIAPVQEWDLVENGGGLIEYPTQ